MQRAVLLAVHAAQHRHSLTHSSTQPPSATERSSCVARAAHVRARRRTVRERAGPAPRRHWCASPNRRASFRTLSFFHVAFYLKRADASMFL